MKKDRIQTVGEIDTGINPQNSKGRFHPWLLFTPRAGKKLRTNRNMLVTMMLIVLLFGSMIAYLVRFTLFEAEKTVASPYNRRMAEASEHVIRGDIKSGDGKVLAHSEEDMENNETRVYPEGRKYAHVVGYSTRGMSGLEMAMNFTLLTSHENLSEQIEKEVFKDAGTNKSYGDTVITTLDSRLQDSAYEALKDMGVDKGAAVVIEPDTGKVLAMVSRPDFDPETIDEDWEEITSDETSSVLLNRVLNGIYPPGSTYKTVVALEYLREQMGEDNFSYNCKDDYDIIESVKMRCYDGEETHGKVNFEQAYAESCNKAFATIGAGLNLAEFVRLNETLLFNKKIDFDLPVKKSRFELTARSEKSRIPQTAIGQGDTLMTPFHNALIMCAIANKGILMKPYLVDRVVNHDNNTQKVTKKEEYGSLMTESQAAKLCKMARAVVEYGTAKKLADADYFAAGKTGTADVEDKKPHSWFVGYAGKEEGEADIAVCVIAENSGSGSRVAVPIAKTIFDTYYKEVY